MGNCESKIYNIGMGCCVPVLAPIENYYTKLQTERYVSGFTYSKEEIDAKTSGNTSGCCITPEEVDEKIAYAKTEIEAEIPSLDVYVTAEDKSNWNNKANVWCGSEADWSLISSGTLDNNTIYLVY